MRMGNWEKREKITLRSKKHCQQAHGSFDARRPERKALVLEQDEERTRRKTSSGDLHSHRDTLDGLRYKGQLVRSLFRSFCFILQIVVEGEEPSVWLIFCWEQKFKIVARLLGFPALFPSLHLAKFGRGIRLVKRTRGWLEFRDLEDIRSSN